MKGWGRAHQAADKAFRAALAAVDPERALRRDLEALAAELEKTPARHVYVVGFGKAALPMARAAHDVLGVAIREGAVVTKTDHAGGVDAIGRIRVREASHPVPDERGVEAAREILNIAQRATEDDLLLALISGGGSALFCAPAPGLTLADKQQTTNLLLRAGADIGALNTVRKHLSAVKGGRLAEAAYPARVVAMMISDVVGDPLDVIASGPTAPDPTTYRDALDVLERHGVLGETPAAARRWLEEGAAGKHEETPKEGSVFLREVTNVIASRNEDAQRAAVEALEMEGFRVEREPNFLTGEARERGHELGERAIALGPNAAFVAGGETTVTVRGAGKGGRSQELGLAAALVLGAESGGAAPEGGTSGAPASLALLAAGTDGTDGPTDAAGALVDTNTIADARAQRLDPERALDDNDAYAFLKEAGALYVTGPTGTNVMDLVIAVRD